MNVIKWFRVGNKTHFLSVPAGDRWIARRGKDDVGTFPGGWNSAHDTLVPYGTDWHPVRDTEVVSVLSGMDEWSAICKLRP